ncbi:MAG: hypothetical protein JSC188_000429 [Candidatus Tokpelaia sp. JSC188]|nr:MAG: hypothetical protein JSC188_000429 [Candidatus Tokpelaia sp. JSC188]
MTTHNHMLRVRFPHEQWVKLRKLAEDADMTMSEIVRNHLGKVKIQNRKHEQDRVVILNRINANLNRIARWVDTHKSATDAVQVITHLMAIEKELAK